MTRRNPAFLSLGAAAVLALAGCGNDPDTAGAGLGAFAPDVRSLIEARRAPDTPAAAPRPGAGFPGLDPALIADFQDPLLGAYIASRGALAGLTVLGTTGDHVVWQTADNIGLTVSDRGLLVQTRGLGADLHVADTRQTEALIAAGQGGTASRRHVYLDGIYSQQDLRMSCTITPAGAETLVLNRRQVATRRFDERCTAPGTEVTNSYWRSAASGRVVQSIQWIGPEIGSIHLQRLND